MFMMTDWTPVTKSLPLENYVVLITVQVGNARGTAIGYVRKGKWKSEVLIDRPDAKVIAWMTFPEPYVW